MADHEHPPGEYCDGCRPVLEADFGAGEQFWLHWVTPNVQMLPGAVSRFKVLSKRTSPEAFECVALREFANGTKMIFGKARLPTEGALRWFVAGMELMLQGLVANPAFKFQETDFRDCDTLEKWEYKMREGTTSFEVFNDLKDRQVPGTEGGHPT